jgi:preprotein translocase subunit SecD
MLDQASASFDQQSRHAVTFQLNALGGKKFGRVTGENIGRPFAIVLDGKVVSAPVIQSQIFTNGQITGNFSVEETQELSLILRAGALPAPLIVLEERSVGPGLGADSIAAGKIAAIVGMVLVIVYMIDVCDIDMIIDTIPKIKKDVENYKETHLEKEVTSHEYQLFLPCPLINLPIN